MSATELSGLARFLAIVLTSIAGSMGCWVWVSFLLAFDARSGGSSNPAPTALGERMLWSVMRPEIWAMGAWCGALFALPAAGCLWNRRLFPASVFVFIVGNVAATLSIGAMYLSGNALDLVAAMPITALSVFAALAYVRCVPHSLWTKPASSVAGPLTRSSSEPS